MEKIETIIERLDKLDNKIDELNKKLDILIKNIELSKIDSLPTLPSFIKTDDFNNPYKITCNDKGGVGYYASPNTTLSQNVMFGDISIPTKVNEAVGFQNGKEIDEMLNGDF